MADFKEISLVVESSIIDLDDSGIETGEPEVTKSSVMGGIKAQGNSIYLTYSETSEGGSVFCDIKVNDEKVTVLRRGAIESTLVFEEGIIHRSDYKLPPYTFDMQINTLKIRSSLTEEGGVLLLHYNMTVGGATRKSRLKITAGK